MGSPLSPVLRARLARGATAAHRFHRWAHHPGCGAYLGEVIAMGRFRVCRGCSLLLAGALLGSAVGSTVALEPVPLAGVALALVLLGTRLRVSKLLSRAAPGALVGLAAAQGGLGLGLASVAVGLGWAVWRLRGPDRSPCTGCPQRVLAVCEGVAPQVRRERALQRWAGWEAAKAFRGPTSEGAR